MRTTAKLGFRFRLIAIGTCAAALVATTVQAQQSADDIRLAEEQAMKTAVATIAPSVVRIETFGGLERVGEQAIAAGPTTGTVVSEDGFVLSSAFNFIQQPSSILVSLPSGKRAAAEIVARDNSRMLVLLKVNTEEKLPVPEFVDPQEMIVGQWSLEVSRAGQTSVRGQDDRRGMGGQGDERHEGRHSQRQGIPQIHETAPRV